MAAQLNRRARRPRDRATGGDQVEGRRAVRELLRAGRRRARQVWIADDTAPAAVLDDIVDLAADRGVPLRRVPGAHLASAARTDAPQGVLAFADPLPEADVDELLRDPHAFLVVLDGVTDPHNVGSILRSAEGAGATGAVLPRHRAAGLGPTVAKASAGAIEHVPVARVGGIPATLERASRAGVWTVGLDGGADDELFALDLGDRPIALVLGSEGRGLSRLAAARCDVRVRIPMRGAVESLNVSVAAALACYEVARKRDTEPEVGFEPTT